MLRRQLGGLEFLSLGYGYVTDAWCPAAQYGTLRRRGVLCKRSCCSAASSAGAAQSGTSFPVGWSGHFS